MDDSGATATPVSLTPQHAWEAAVPILYPVLRPAGTRGLPLAALTDPSTVVGKVDSLIDEGPAGLVVAYAMVAGGFDVLVNGEHFVAWAVAPATLREAAFANLRAWSATAPWSVEESAGRRIVSSDTGDGWDASRILLPEVIAHLESELGGPATRVLVGLPARHLLVAARMRADDPELAPLFADFVLEYAGDSDEAIDRRVFEIREGRLVPFDPQAG
jgi:uncharacterized protein YtpQ (UPF0354 family)